MGSCGKRTFGETTRTSPRVATPSESPPVTSTWCCQHPGFGPFLLVYSGPNPTFEEIHYLVSGRPKHNVRTAGQEDTGLNTPLSSFTQTQCHVSPVILSFFKIPKYFIFKCC